MLISSDTNIWFDFESIGCLHHPFMLKDHSFFLSDLTYEEEIHKSYAIKNYVLSKQLQITSVTAEELALVDKLSHKYINLSFYDLVALSIAIKRNWILLTGDGNLRKAAIEEKVQCHGTIWIYDELLRAGKISKKSYKENLKKLLNLTVAGQRRLPLEELMKRINNENE